MMIADMIDGPVKMVTFDLYDTLVEADPPGWERYGMALEQAGYTMDTPSLMRAYTAGQHYFTEENGRLPIRDRGEDGILTFRLNMTAVSMEELGLPTDARSVQRVLSHYQDEIKNSGEPRYRTFEEVPEVLERLRKAKVMRGVISNADSDVTRFCLHMGFAESMDIIVTSALVGWEKPDARTFYAALEPFNLPSSSVLHVGDQPGSDVRGARAIGMAAALVDRYDQYPSDLPNALRVTSLTQLVDLVLEHNESYDGEEFGNL